jgi:DNA-binding GntR family transcriptional regulator
MDDTKRFVEVRARSMRYDVLRQLRNAILHGAFRPGERLNESEIAREMGISRGPVREAILELEREGLVRIEHRRGAYVVKLEPEVFGDLVDLRILLETHAVRIATGRCKPGDCDGLDHIIEQMRLAHSAGDTEKVVDNDLDFHRTLCSMAGNQLLLEAWEQLAGRLRLAMLLWIEHGLDDTDQNVQMHREVLAAMRQGDGERAAQRINLGNREAAAEMVPILAQYGIAEDTGTKS